jgi:hypothetical protein
MTAIGELIPDFELLFQGRDFLSIWAFTGLIRPDPNDADIPQYLKTTTFESLQSSFQQLDVSLPLVDEPAVGAHHRTRDQDGRLGQYRRGLGATLRTRGCDDAAGNR